MAGEIEEPLAGGNQTAGVVRVGDTVRRPSGEWTPAVDALLRHLRDVGYEHAPRSYGLDERGRHVVEWIEGDTIHPFMRADDVGAQLHRVGSLIRRFHEAVSSFRPPADARWNVVISPDETTTIAHHDLAPWNFVAGGGREVFIDWDLAAPGSPMWDLAWAAHGFVPLVDVPPEDAGDRLRWLVDGYGADEDQRRRLLELLSSRANAMVDLLRRGRQTETEPWSRLWDQGHARIWTDHVVFVERHQALLEQRLLG